MSELPDNLFTSFTSDFDTATSASGGYGNDFKRRRENWPVARFRKNQAGQEEMRVRILPLPTVITKGYWIRTKTGKTYWSDSPAWNPITQTSNGPDPVAEVLPAEIAKSKTIAYCIDFLHLQQLNQMGITPDKYVPYSVDQQLILHPYRVVDISSQLMQQINIIRGMKGNASDPQTGYILNMVKTVKNNKVEYQVVPGDNFPVEPWVLQDLARMNMPDIRQYHEAEPLQEIVKSLFFNGHVDHDKAVEILTRYKDMGLVEADQVSISLKGMQTYSEKHGASASKGISAGLQAPALPAPGFAPSVQAPQAPVSFAPPVTLPTPPAPAQAPASFTAPTPLAPPSAPAGFPSFNIPGVSAPESIPAPAAPPKFSGFGGGGIPGLPSIPGIPSASVNIPKGLLD